MQIQIYSFLPPEFLLQTGNLVPQAQSFRKRKNIFFKLICSVLFGGNPLCKECRIPKQNNSEYGILNLHNFYVSFCKDNSRTASYYPFNIEIYCRKKRLHSIVMLLGISIFQLLNEEMPLMGSEKNLSKCLYCFF